MNHTRRSYLAATGTVAVGTAIGGCLGGPPAAETDHSCDLTERDPVSELPQPRVGPSDATVTVAVFEDFSCPHCARFATGDFSRLKEEFADDPAVAFEHYDFPIPVDEWSERVANAARSIQEAHDDETFFEFSVAAYENQDDYSWQLVGDLAEDVGVDPCRTLSDATYGTYNQVLEANKQDGETRGIPGTPATFVNGELTQSAYSNIESAIESNR